MTTVSGRGFVAAAYLATGRAGNQPHFVTTPVACLTLDHAGIVGDLHSGALRRSGAREPWLPRGSTLRNDRQISALCQDELEDIAKRLATPRLAPEWLGGNLVISGVPGFSAIAPGSRLAFGGNWGGRGRFDGSAVLRVEAYNKPCRQSGRAIAAALARPELEFAFVKQAAALRGLVLSVDMAGSITPGDAVVVIAPMASRR